IGTVSTFRDKTELRQMINTLSEVKRYSDDLRAQTHEFSNKMYVISGLLQLGRYHELKKMIQEELDNDQIVNKKVYSLLQDYKLQAILLGKISQASEKKVKFVIDENTQIDKLPSHIEMSHIMIVLGNIIDNAIEEVAKFDDGKISFFATDIGNDIIFEI